MRRASGDDSRTMARWMYAARAPTLLLALLGLVKLATPRAAAKQEAEKWRPALPYMIHLMEQTDAQYLPMVSIPPHSVAVVARHQLHISFRHEHVNSSVDRMELLVRARRKPHAPLSFCMRNHHTHNCTAYRTHFESPIEKHYVLDLGSAAADGYSDGGGGGGGGGGMLDIELYGHGFKRLLVVSVILLEKVKPPQQQQEEEEVVSSIPVSPRLRRSSIHMQSDPTPPPAPSQQAIVCHLQRWTVSMKALGFDSIVWPSEFDANYCVGSCPLVDEPHSNHALIRQIYNENKNASMPAVPEACCVVKSVLPLDVLFHTQEGVLKRNQHKDLRARECVCL